MRVIVTGSRDWADFRVMEVLLTYAAELADARHEQLVVVHGAHPAGADLFAGIWARRQLDVREEPIAADWDRYGGAAGPIRNERMVERGADLCLAFIGRCRRPDCFKRRSPVGGALEPYPHGSHGSTGCSNLARRAGIRLIMVEDYT